MPNVYGIKDKWFSILMDVAFQNDLAIFLDKENIIVYISQEDVEVGTQYIVGTDVQVVLAELLYGNRIPVQYELTADVLKAVKPSEFDEYYSRYVDDLKEQFESGDLDFQEEAREVMFNFSNKTGIEITSYSTGVLEDTELDVEFAIPSHIKIGDKMYDKHEVRGSLLSQWIEESGLQTKIESDHSFFKTFAESFSFARDKLGYVDTLNDLVHTALTDLLIEVEIEMDKHLSESAFIKKCFEEGIKFTVNGELIDEE